MPPGTSNSNAAPDEGLISQVTGASAERAALPPAPRPAWIEIDLARLRRNFELINRDRPPHVALLAVVKDNAYGHGAVAVAQAALAAGAAFLGVNTLPEAVELRAAGINVPILMLGERHPDELAFCVEHRLTVSLGDLAVGRLLNEVASKAGVCVPVHLKLDTGMSRFGVHWHQAAAALEALRPLPGLVLEGVMTHLAMSDEADKTFALLQIGRFQEALAVLMQRGARIRFRHVCNTGGFLDLPAAHFDMVRLGILPLGVYPSAVCRRIAGLEPVMSVKARLVAVRTLQRGDVYGYGLRYRAEREHRIGVLPLGYGDGYPRLRNTGHVFIRGRRAPIIGGVAMDSMGVDLTDLPDAQLWDEAVILGRQGAVEVSAHEIAAWKQSVSYDVLTGWRARLPRLYE